MTDGNCVHGVERGSCLLCLNDQELKRKRIAIAPPSYKSEAKVLIEFLESSQKWQKSADILRHFNGFYDPQLVGRAFTATDLRHAAKAARGQVISGQKGYKATRASNVDEVQESAAFYMKTAKGCMERRSDILHVFHKGTPAPERKVANG